MDVYYISKSITCLIELTPLLPLHINSLCLGLGEEDATAAQLFTSGFFAGELAGKISLITDAELSVR